MIKKIFLLILTLLFLVACEDTPSSTKYKDDNSIKNEENELVEDLAFDDIDINLYPSEDYLQVVKLDIPEEIDGNDTFYFPYLADDNCIYACIEKETWTEQYEAGVMHDLANYDLIKYDLKNKTSQIIYSANSVLSMNIIRLIAYQDRDMNNSYLPLVIKEADGAKSVDKVYLIDMRDASSELAYQIESYPLINYQILYKDNKVYYNLTSTEICSQMSEKMSLYYYDLQTKENVLVKENEAFGAYVFKNHVCYTNTMTPEFLSIDKSLNIPINTEGFVGLVVGADKIYIQRVLEDNPNLSYYEDYESRNIIDKSDKDTRADILANDFFFTYQTCLYNEANTPIREHHIYLAKENKTVSIEFPFDVEKVECNLYEDYGVLRCQPLDGSDAVFYKFSLKNN